VPRTTAAVALLLQIKINNINAVIAQQRTVTSIIDGRLSSQSAVTILPVKPRLVTHHARTVTIDRPSNGQTASPSILRRSAICHRSDDVDAGGPG